MSLFSAALNGRRSCLEEINARNECYERQREGINTEACFEEELNEKRCLSFYVCPNEARKFYGVSNGFEKKGECSLWAEYFAFKDSKDKMSGMVHTHARELIDRDKGKMQTCRKILMDLSVCLSQYSEIFMKLDNKKVDRP